MIEPFAPFSLGRGGIQSSERDRLFRRPEPRRLRQDLMPRAVRQSQIGHQDIEHLLLQERDGLGHGACFAHLMPPPLQQHRQDVPGILVILDDKQLHASESRSRSALRV